MISYPEFVDNKAYLGMDSSLSEKDQLWAMLSNITRVHLLTADKYHNFDDLIHEYLTLGCEVFCLETGIVSEVNKEGKYIVKDVLSPLEVLEKGQEFELEDTYCREVIKSQSVLGFPEVGRLDYMNCHPVYQNLKLEAYLSAPIFVEEELYGTLNFTSTHIRHHGFSSHERDLISLMANAIGNYILLRDKESKLVDLNNRMKRFVGYVAHDLRNPIGSIIGFAKMGTKQETTKKRLKSIIERIIPTAETALEFVNTILENAALSSGKLTLNKTTLTANDLINTASESLASLLSSSQTTIELSGETATVVSCDTDRLHQALVNLLSNAGKYSPDQSVIAIQITQNGQYAEIQISNPVASIQQDANKEPDQQIYGSTGFGLDIAREILAAHGSELHISKTDSAYTVQFQLDAVTPHA